MKNSLEPQEALRAAREWLICGRANQIQLGHDPAGWLVMGGRGSGKTRLGSEWVIALARGLPPFARPGSRHGLIALVGETLGDVREVMIDGPSGIASVARGDRPRYEASRRRLLWPSGAVAQVFSSEDPESLRGPQFAAAWFTELGCPAVDKGPNQPNVFPDPKSSESFTPYFSSGGRSDLAQLRFLEAHMKHWDPATEGFEEANNPLSPVYGGRMVDFERTYLWAWDTRPFPAFPQRADLWSDGPHWSRGLWLNGRLANPDTGALVDAILADHGYDDAVIGAVNGSVQGYVIADPAAARAAIEPICDLFDLSVREENGRLVVERSGASAGTVLEVEDLVAEDAETVLETVRIPDHELPVEALISFVDPGQDYQAATVRRTRTGVPGARQHLIHFPGVLEPGQAGALLDDWLKRVWYQRETVSFAVPQPNTGFNPGALIRLPASAANSDFLVTGIDDGMTRKVEARQIVRATPAPWRETVLPALQAPPLAAGKPHVLFLDLPAGAGGTEPTEQFRVAVWQKPWRSQIVFASPENEGFASRQLLRRPASLGRLVEELGPGVEGRILRDSFIKVELFDADAASVSLQQMLNGANAAATRSATGAWEVIQFRRAEQVADNIWLLSELLRGQLGTTDAMLAGAASGSDFVMLDDAVVPAGLGASEIGLALNWKIGPAATDISDLHFATGRHSGGLRARTPLAPVHIRARPAGGDIMLSWIRRGRLDADGWDAPDIPLGEEREEYSVEIAGPGGGPVRTVSTRQPDWLYPAALISTDFGTRPGTLDVTVRQAGGPTGWGIPGSSRVKII